MYNNYTNDLINSMPYTATHEGTAYYTDRFVAFREPGVTLWSVHPGKHKEIGKQMAAMFSGEAYGGYTLASKQPTQEYLKGKSRFFFGMGQQLVNARYLRIAFKVFGKGARFYTTGRSPYDPILVRSDNHDLEMLILPIRYDKNDPKTYSETEQKRFHVLTWDYDSGEDDKGDFHTKTRAVQEMRLFVESCGHDGAAVIDRNTKQAVAVYGNYPRFQY